MRSHNRRKFLSTLSLRRATSIFPSDVARKKISIHALLAESDKSEILFQLLLAISIHALLAESDRKPIKWYDIHIIFLSTLSLRRATTLR